jgi:hypothetical protein
MRYLGWVVAALTMLTIVLSVLVGRTEQRLDRLDDRFTAVCELLSRLPVQTVNAQMLRERLDCPP